ncbi:MAG: tRNA pseudouridine(55) synthase TruB [Patescibacteria group bacterium]
MIPEILLIDKDRGMSSFDVIRILKKKFPRGTKIGHSGTLDPLATGLLVIGLGKGTKRLAEFLKLPKRYVAEATFGMTSLTYDAQGPFTTVVSESDLLLSPISVSVVETVILENFLGEISQTPPDFSAVHVNGERAYEIARRGEKVVLEPRKVTITSCDVVSCIWPKLVLDVRCSSGTYIRSLVHDLGAKLGCGAYMSNLRRVSVGDYHVDNAHKISEFMA